MKVILMKHKTLPYPAPLFPLAIALSTGIMAGSFHPLPTAVVLGLLAVTMVLTMLTGRRPQLQSVGLLVCSVLIGLAIAPDKKDHEGTAKGQTEWMEAVVTSRPSARPKTMRIDLLLPVKGKEKRCYFWTGGDSTTALPSLGQNILVRIHANQFVSSSDWTIGGRATSRLSSMQRLRLRALLWRDKLLARLTADASAEARPDAEAVLAAMVLGDKTAIDRQLRSTYATTGASHILALSGLHLGIIYLLLTRLIPGRRRFWLTQVLTVVAIWAFALLTGLSVSVIRAALMISAYALFSMGGRRRAPLGVLSLTAIVMLLADSSAIFDVGFQLSFLSMLSILLWMPLADSVVPLSWMRSHPVLQGLYGLLAVSLAAQLGTAPLVAYYFGQLPTYFLLTNLLVVPAATLILYGSVVTLIIPALSGVLLRLVGWLNTALAWMSAWPAASIGGLHPSVVQVVAAYVVEAVVWLLLFRLVGNRRRV